MIKKFLKRMFAKFSTDTEIRLADYRPTGPNLALANHVMILAFSDKFVAGQQIGRLGGGCAGVRDLIVKHGVHDTVNQVHWVRWGMYRNQKQITPLGPAVVMFAAVYIGLCRAGELVAVTKDMKAINDCVPPELLDAGWKPTLRPIDWFDKDQTKRHISVEYN